MLYLEDFLEVVEGIPAEVQEKTLTIQELDSHINKTSENLEEQMKIFFSSAKKMKSGERASSFEKIRRQYYKLLEDADEKVSIATKLHGSLEKYVRKIDGEIEKFRCELEADSPGITEILEKKSLELDEPARDKENRLTYSRGNISSFLPGLEWRSNSLKKEEADLNLSSNLSLSPPSSSSLSYTLGHIGVSGNAIAAAASQAIAATQQVRLGRKTASLAASYDAVSQGILPAELSIGSELAHAAKAALAASSLPQDNQNLSSNWSNSDVAVLSSGSLSREGSVTNQSVSTSLSQKRHKKGRSSNLVKEVVVKEEVPEPVVAPLAESPEWYDSNEPRYCICNHVSYGNMVACDNPKCPQEWFHYECVGIIATPKGKWYCPQCATALNRRGRK